MTLAGMVSLDEGALICDFAETYQIYNWRALPLRTAATLAAGLRDDARIRMKLRGDVAPPDTVLLGTLCDRLGDLMYWRGVYKERPSSMVEALGGKEEVKERPKSMKTFSSPEEFMKARQRHMQGGS